MSSSLTLPVIHGDIPFATTRLPSCSFPLAAGLKWDLQSGRHMSQYSRRTRSQAINVLANTNVPSGKGKSAKQVDMVDPVEAKRLAAKQMEKIKAKDKFKKRQQIEAINGGWAMIGLTIGLVIEGRTGNSIPAQLAGYWDAFVGLFVR